MPNDLISLLISSSGGGGGVFKFRDLTDTPSSYSNKQVLFFGTDGVYSDSNFNWDNTLKRLSIGTVDNPAKVNILNNIGNGAALYLKTITGIVGSTCFMDLDVTDVGDQCLIQFSKQGVPQWKIASRNAIDTPENRLGFFNVNLDEVFTILNNSKFFGFNNKNPSAICDTTPTFVDTKTYSRPNPLITTTQRDALVSMPSGACVYDDTQKSIRTYDGVDWFAVQPKNVIYTYILDDLGPQVPTITDLTGTYSTTGTTVNGSGSAFLTDFDIGEFIYDSTSLTYRKIASITSDILMTLTSAFTIDVSAGTAVKSYIKLITTETSHVYEGGRISLSVPMNLPEDVNINVSTLTMFSNLYFSIASAYPFNYTTGGEMRDCLISYNSNVKGTIFTAQSIINVLRYVRNTFIITSDCKLFDLKKGAGTSYFIIDLCNVQSSGGYADIGTVDSCVSVFRGFDIDGFKAGLTITDGEKTTINTLRIYNGQNTTADLLKFDGTAQGRISISDYEAEMLSNERAFNFISATTYDEGVSISQSTFNDKNLLYRTGSKTFADVGFKSVGNTNLPNSTISAEIYLNGNTTQTDIPSQNAWVKINSATPWTGKLLERISLNTADGVKTCNALEDTKVNLDGNTLLEPATATKDLKTQYWCRLATQYVVTFTNATNTINETGTARQNGDTISFEDTAGTLPSELRKDVIYYVVNAGVNSFQVSYTLGGAVVSFTDDGTPTNSYKVAEEHGSIARNTIAATAPRQLIPQALTLSRTNVKISKYIANITDAVNIIVGDDYSRLKE